MRNGLTELKESILYSTLLLKISRNDAPGGIGRGWL